MSEVTVRADANVLGLTRGATVKVEHTAVVANHVAAGLLTIVEPPEDDADEPGEGDSES